MKRLQILLIAYCFVASGQVVAQSFQSDVATFIEATCIQCHDKDTETPLDLATLGHDLSNRDTFKTWERVFERVKKGERPPRSKPRPDKSAQEKALGSLKGALVEANLAARGGQRTPLRRLTRLEYAYTIEDLLGIDESMAAELSQLLPAEADCGGFDTVAANQSISPLHVRSYLEAADRTLDVAMRVGSRPETARFTVHYVKSFYLAYIANKKGLGLGIVKKLDDAYVAFFDFGATYTFHSESEGFKVPTPGRYRVTFEAYPYQAKTAVGLTVYRGRKAGAAASLDELIGSFELVGEATRTLTLIPFLRPGDLISPSVADLDGNPFRGARLKISEGYDMKNYKGEGVALKSLSIEGPLVETWPPPGSRQLLTGVEFDESGKIRLTKEPYQHILDIVAAFAPRAFRRPLVDGEAEAYASLARPILADGRPFVDAVRVPLRAILTSPGFLFQACEAKALDDFALASRLSYFLWRSMPDATLFDIARQRRLSDPAILAQQVDRMLADFKSQRFIKDYAGQAFRLYELKANTPDKGLYPEYDDRLGQAMQRETELFLVELIAQNHGVGKLIDADFTFANRRLADHYGIKGVEGQEMRQLTLPKDSLRGGLLTQASIQKITANGTTTSPVRRGNFVLAKLLGKPAPPPPAGIGSIEPDTRGKTTIRQQLNAHRNSPQCANCHRAIDPPGFALESFDPIGGFRTNYRVSGGEFKYGDVMVPMPYRKGPAVDPSGATSEGTAFSGIKEYKRILLQKELDQVARHLASRLLVFSTGAEIEFADRDAVERIVDQGRDRGYPIKTMIHAVVASELFRRP
jgi:hypothetical protein